MKYLKLVLDKITKRIMSCPSCHRKIRFPIRPGKTLRVTCPSCHCMFDISFKNKIFSFNKQNLLIDRIKYKLLNLEFNKKAYLRVLVAVILGISLYLSFFGEKDFEQGAHSKVDLKEKIYEEI